PRRHLSPLGGFPCFEIFVAAAGAENDDAFVRFDLALLRQLLYSRKRGPALRRCENSFELGHVSACLHHFVIACSDSLTMTRIEIGKNYEITKRLRHSQSRRNGGRIIPELRCSRSLLKRLDDRRASLRLCRNHSRTLTSNKTHRLEFLEGFPHA